KASYNCFKSVFDTIKDAEPAGPRPAPYGLSSNESIYHVPITHSDGRLFIAFWQFGSVIVSSPNGGGTPFPNGTLTLPHEVEVVFTPALPYQAAFVHDPATATSA